MERRSYYPFGCFIWNREKKLSADKSIWQQWLAVGTYDERI